MYKSTIVENISSSSVERQYSLMTERFNRFEKTDL